MIVGIEGFSGAGKTTVGQMLSIATGWDYINPGICFRGLAADSIYSRVDDPDLSSYMAGASLDVDFSGAGQPLISVNGRDVSGLLYLPEVSLRSASIGNVAESEIVDSYLRTIIRSKNNAIIDGKGLIERYPSISLSFYLVASFGVRAYRKFQQAQGVQPTYTFAMACLDLAKKDAIEAEGNKLVLPEKSIVINTDRQKPKQVCSFIASLVPPTS